MPRKLTPEEIQEFKKWEAEHEKKLETDPEYRKWWEKQLKDFEKIGFVNDCIE